MENRKGSFSICVYPRSSAVPTQFQSVLICVHLWFQDIQGVDMEPIHTHISRQYNAELEEIRSRVLQMGGLVEQQIDQALNALVRGDTALGEAVIMDETKVNKLEVTIDEECNQIIARRQPAAGDLRLAVALFQTHTTHTSSRA